MRPIEATNRQTYRTTLPRWLVWNLTPTLLYRPSQRQENPLSTKETTAKENPTTNRRPNKMNSDLIFHSRDANVTIEETKESTYKLIRIRIEAEDDTTISIFRNLTSPEVIYPSK